MKESTQSTPSLVRIRRVLYFLDKDPSYKVSADTETYTKGTESFVFPKYVCDVARAIHAAGEDSCKMKRPQICAWADHVLKGGPQPKPAPANQSSDQAEPANGDAQCGVHQAEPDEAPVAAINVPVRIAIYTLLVSARELTRLDRKAGSEDLGKLIDTAAMAYLASINQKIAAQPTVMATPPAPPVIPANVEQVKVPNPAA